MAWTCSDVITILVGFEPATTANDICFDFFTHTQKNIEGIKSVYSHHIAKDGI